MSKTGKQAVLAEIRNCSQWMQQQWEAERARLWKRYYDARERYLIQRDLRMPASRLNRLADDVDAFRIAALRFQNGAQPV